MHVSIPLFGFTSSESIAIVPFSPVYLNLRFTSIACAFSLTALIVVGWVWNGKAGSSRSWILLGFSSSNKWMTFVLLQADGSPMCLNIPIMCIQNFISISMDLQ